MSDRQLRMQQFAYLGWCEGIETRHTLSMGKPGDEKTTAQNWRFGYGD